MTQAIQAPKNVPLFEADKAAATEDGIDPNKVRMIGDRLLVKPAKISMFTEGGIALPPEYADVTQLGVAIKVGPKVKDVEEGQVIYFAKYAGITLSLSGQTFISMEARDVLGAFEAPSKLAVAEEAVMAEVVKPKARLVVVDDWEEPTMKDQIIDARQLVPRRAQEL